jgi:radical SAM protein with 4Fe4S-binding SPASM domain
MENKMSEKRDYVLRKYKLDPNLELSKIFGERFAQYRKEWDAAIQGSALPNFPLNLGIELIDACNMKCKFCYRSKSKNTNVQMDLETYKAIIDECAKYSMPSISYGFGEPLMSKHFSDMISYAHKKGVIDTILTTNGVLLTETLSEFLIKNQLTRLHVSIDAASPEIYKKVRGGDLSIVERNTLNFLKIREKIKSKLPLVRVSFVYSADNKHEANSFVKKWEDKADYVDIQLYVSGDETDNLREMDVQDFSCHIPYRHISVRANGDIQPCCSFYGKHLIFGNFNKGDSIYNVWHGDRMNGLRRSLEMKKYFLCCKNCIACQKDPEL